VKCNYSKSGGRTMGIINFLNKKTIEDKQYNYTNLIEFTQKKSTLILESNYFTAKEDLSYPIRGMVKLESKRNIKSYGDLTEEEIADYITILSKIKKIQREKYGIERVFYFSNQESSQSFHMWIMPTIEWMFNISGSQKSNTTFKFRKIR
jgi:diadenosine tetraphosphate (Ap4A) HIT family hydrolase